jgi:hypothetical protein
VATVTNIQRPSTLASACVPSAATAIGARAYAAGHPAVLERLLVSNQVMPRMAGASKINNSISDIQTLGKGVAKSIFGLRVHTVDQVQGGDARGIPPRGRPV